MAARGRRNRRSEFTQRLDAAKQEADELKEELERNREETEKELDEVWNEIGQSGRAKYGFSVVRRLQGHFGKIYSLMWGGDSTRLVSASQDGKLLVWNAYTETRQLAVNLKSAWVMTCAFEQDQQKFVACGGLDNVCSLFNIASPPSTTLSETTHELTGHEGYLSCCRFLSTDEILTSSGDSTCVLWDIESNTRKVQFTDHAADVMSLSLSPNDKNVFCSGSCDGSVRVWDVRAGKCTHTFFGHDSDVNAVDFYPSGNVISSASDDSTCRMFDLRSRGTIAVFSDQMKMGSCVTSIAHSASGSLLFAGYEDNTAVAWETTSQNLKWYQLGLSRDRAARADAKGLGHSARVSCLGVNKKGQALATGSWDQFILVWSTGDATE